MRIKNNMKKILSFIIGIFLLTGITVQASDLIIESKAQTYKEEDNKIKFDGDVKVTIDGPSATLVAMSSGNQASDELNVVDHRMLYNGSVLAILRSDIKAGTITVIATCDGLKSAKAKFTTK
jgi:hypothetical protein